MKKIIIYSPIIMFLMLAGCALTDQPVDLQGAPSVNGVSHVSNAKTLTVASFSDSRGEGADVLAHKINQNLQQASGKYIAKEPIAKIIRKKVVLAMQDTGYNIAKSGGLVLQANLVAIDFRYINGWLSSSLHCNIQMEFSLFDAKTHRQVWDQLLNGAAEYSGNGTMHQYVFNLAVDNLIKNLLNSSGFQQNIK